MGVRRAWGQNGHLPPLWKLGLWTKHFWKNLKSASNSDLLIWFLQWQFFCGYETHTAQESGSQLSCHAVMSLQFTHVPSFACGGGLRKWRADCSTVGLYCVTITWQQICKGSRCTGCPWSPAHISKRSCEVTKVDKIIQFFAKWSLFIKV